MDKQVKIRVGGGLHYLLTQAAIIHRRPLNKEIINRLEDSFDRETALEAIKAQVRAMSIILGIAK